MVIQTQTGESVVLFHGEFVPELMIDRSRETIHNMNDLHKSVEE